MNNVLGKLNVMPLEKRLYLLQTMPSHLIEARQKQRLQCVLINFAFIATKISELGLQSIIKDFVLAKEHDLSNEEFDQITDFLRKNSQKLTELDNLLFSLCNHEGPRVLQDQTRELDAKARWDKPYFRSTSKGKPSPKTEPLQEQHIEILSRWDYPSTPAVGLASNVQYTFHNLGKDGFGKYKIGVVNLENGLPLPEITIQAENQTRRSQPIRFYASPNAQYLVVLFSTGNAQLLNLIEGENEPYVLYKFSYLQSATRTTGIGIGVDFLLYQESERVVVKIELPSLRKTSFQNLLPNSTSNELSGVVTLNKNIIITIRSKNDTYLFSILPDGSYAQLYCFKGKEVFSICSSDLNHIAIAFSDHTLYVLTVSHGQVEIYREVSNMLPSEMVWVEGKLLWITTGGDFWMWSLNEEKPVRLISEIDAEFSVLKVMHLEQGSNNSLVVATQSTTFRFKISQSETSQSQAQNIIRYLVPGKHSSEDYSALVEQNNEIWLWDSASKEQERIVGQPNLEHKRFFDLDQQKNVFITGKPDIIYNLESGTKIDVENVPIDITSITSDVSGGFWVAESTGDIYFVSVNGICNQKKTYQLNDVKKSHIYSWGNLVVWIGTCLHTTSAGTDLTDVIRFYRRISPKQKDLESIGQRFFAVSDGLNSGIAFNPATNEFWIFWHRDAKNHNTDGLTVKIGTPEDFLKKQERSELLVGIPHVLTSIIFTQDGTGLFCLTDAENLYFVDTETLRVQATFSPSKRIQTMARGLENEPALLLALTDGNVFWCDFVGGDHDSTQ